MLLFALAALVGVGISAGSTSPTGPGGAELTTPPSVNPSPSAKVACKADEPEERDSQQYSNPPPMSLEKEIDYRAVITTSCGVIEMDLLEHESPITVNNFVFLANEGFYDGLTFHRVEQNSIIQGGDPEGDGSGGAGYTIPDEFPKNPKGYVFGTAGMANEGPGTGSSQFFIVVHDPDPEGGYEPAGYRPSYSIFGKVDPDDSGSVETLVTISEKATQRGDDPVTATTPIATIYIESVEIVDGDGEPVDAAG